MASINRSKLSKLQARADRLRSGRAKLKQSAKQRARKPRRPLLVKGECTPLEFAEWWWHSEPYDLHPNQPGDRERLILGDEKWGRSPASLLLAIKACERTLQRQHPAFNREPLPPDVEEDFKEYRSILIEQYDKLTSVDYSRPPRRLSRRPKRRPKPKDPGVWPYFDAALRKAQREARQGRLRLYASLEVGDAVWNNLPDWVQASTTLTELASGNFLECPDDLRDVLGPRLTRKVKRELTAAWADHLKKHPKAAVLEPEPEPEEKSTRAPLLRRRKGAKKPKQPKFDPDTFLVDIVNAAQVSLGMTYSQRSDREFGERVFNALPAWLQDCETIGGMPYVYFSRDMRSRLDDMEELESSGYKALRQEITQAWLEQQEKLQQGLTAPRVLARRKPQQESLDDHAARVARRRQAAESGGSS